MNLEEEARNIAQRVNKRIAVEGIYCPDHIFDKIVEDLVPEGWQWTEASAVGRPREIIIVAYDPPKHNMDVRGELPREY